MCQNGFFSDYTSDGITEVSDDDGILDMIKELDELLNYTYTNNSIPEGDIAFIKHLLEETTSIFSEKISPANDGLFVLEGLYVYVQLTYKFQLFLRKIKGYEENCDR